MPRACPGCGERRRDVAAFCGRCGARVDADPSRAPRRPTRTRASSEASRRRPPLVTRRRAIATGLVVGVVAVLAAGLEIEDPVGEVAVPLAAPAEGAPAPRVLAAPPSPPALAPCDRTEPADLCIRWRRPRAHEHPVLADTGTVFLAQSGGAVAALDRASGAIRWSTPVTIGEVVDGTASEPALALVGAGGRPQDGLAGVDPRDGALLWTAPAASSESEVAPDGDAWLVLEPGLLRRLDVDTGAERWRWPSRDPAAVHLVASTDSAIVVASDHTVTALDRATGNARWAVPVPRLRGTAVADPASLVALDGDGRMLGITTTDGTVRWDTRLAFDARSAVRVTGTEHLVLVAIDPPLADDGTRTPRIVGVDPRTGAVQWVHLYRSAVDRRGIVATADVAVLVGTTRPGAITALDLGTGGIAWQKDLGEDPAHVRVVDGQVLAASGREVVLLSGADGSVLAEARSGSPVIGIVSAEPGSAVLKTSTGLVVTSLPTSLSPTSG